MTSIGTRQTETAGISLRHKYLAVGRKQIAERWRGTFRKIRLRDRQQSQARRAVKNREAEQIRNRHRVRHVE